MSLLIEPPELAEWWTILQAVMVLDMSVRTLEHIAFAVDEDTDHLTSLSEIWDQLDFCAQSEIAYGMELYDAECLES